MFRLSTDKAADWLKIHPKLVEYFETKITHDYSILTFNWYFFHDNTYLFLDDDGYFMVCQDVNCPITGAHFLLLMDVYAPRRFEAKPIDDLAKELGCTEIRWWSPRPGATRHWWVKKYWFNCQYRKPVDDNDYEKPKKE